MDPKRIRIIKQQHKHLLNVALSDMFIAGKGSPAYYEAYTRYRKSAKILAASFFNDRVIQSRITERYKR